MSKVGGTIVVVAGLFSIIPAVMSLLFGGVESIYDFIGLEWFSAESLSNDTISDQAPGAIELGSLQTRWLTIITSLLIIIFGIFSIIAKQVLILGLLLVGFSTVNIVFGTSLVSIAMSCALVGGILVMVSGIRSRAKRN